MGGRSVDYGRLAFDLLDDFERLDRPDQVMARMAWVLSQFGFTSFIIATVPEAIGNAYPRFLMNGWPTEWSNYYARSKFYQDDPIAARCRQTVDPFEWAEATYDPELNPRAERIMRAARDFKLNQGFVVPILRNMGMLSAVVMAGERPEFEARAKRALHLIGIYAHLRASELVGAAETLRDPKRLTEGEREALRWTAAGKSSWEISVILDISEATVVWRLKQAAVKLNAVNRTQAVVKAIMAKEIEL